MFAPGDKLTLGLESFEIVEPEPACEASPVGNPILQGFKVKLRDRTGTVSEYHLWTDFAGTLLATPV